MSSPEEIGSQLIDAFAGYGITPGFTPPGEAASRIGESLIAGRLLTALEVWFVLGGRPPVLRAILTAADPDEFREEARATNYQRARLARAFRGRPPTGAQPVWFAVGRGSDDLLGWAAREELLLAAHGAQPTTIPILMALGVGGGPGDRETAPSRAGWCRAALAVQPRSTAAWLNMGVALHEAADQTGPAAAYREALRLDPKLAQAHTNWTSAAPACAICTTPGPLST
jgi:hypothetical protein